ncbi:MAG: GH3 auxin-responsive promoter family protein [Verrucomicrobia bacterium]|nr:GH3 auxin-responsive promoter family protein [Cytophagales bacterium]
MNHGLEVQEREFSKLIRSARKTEWGRKYGYEDIKNTETFQQRVPISNYEDIFPYIERMMQGEQNVLWSSPIRLFAKSSGTTNARSKFIPVSLESLESCHYQGGKDLITLYAHNRPDAKVFAGKALSIGGSLQPYSENKNALIGDISAIVMKNLPGWVQFFRTPGLDIALMDEWEEKIEKMAQLTAKQEVTTILGVPTWTVVLLERILELTGKQHMLEVWQNFEVFCHGAVSFEPYRDLFKKKFFPSDQVNYMEIYNASEGYFGLQDDISVPEMLLMLDYGVFYEFIPLEEENNPNPKVLTLAQVEAGKNYALVISTNAGLWRYKIGDTIKFTSVNPYRIKISGRTKHFINAFGEEMIVENAEIAITKACEATGAVIANYTAAPVFMEKGKRGGHEWIIEFITEPTDLQYFTQVLDATLREINSDYDAKRYKDMALVLPIIHPVPEKTFYNWLKKRNKLGGQHKVPRLSNSREYVDEILTMLEIA